MKTTLIIAILLTIGPGKISSQILKLKGTANKTTSIVFPSDIIHVDLGFMNHTIGVEIDEKVPNLLKIRLTKDFKDTTNMLVVTKDNHIYSFDIEYIDELKQYVYLIKLTDAVTANKKEIPLGKQDSSNIIHDIEKKILEDKNTISRTDITKKNKMVMFLKNIYTRNEKLYLNIYVSNKSNLSYIIDFHNIFMTTSTTKVLKETAAQDIQISTRLCKNVKEIPAHSVKYLTIEMDKFTLEDDKICIFELYERDGGRHLRLKISNSELLSSTPL